MTTATNGWDLTVPDDADELYAELRRHGVTPGQRVHIALQVTPRQDPGKPKPATQARRLGFTGALKDAEPDLSARTDEYLAKGLGLD